MPPHCDTMDGPVVTAARDALEAENVTLVLPYVPEDGEDEVVNAFNQVTEARRAGEAAREVADRYFFETVVRVHRAGEGAPFTGLKPAGMDPGPVIPVAEQAIETGSAQELAELLCDVVRSQVEDRLGHVQQLKGQAAGSVEQARAYVEAMLGLQVWAHGLYECAQSEPHAGHHEHE